MAVTTRLAVAAHDRAQLTAWVRAATTRRSLAERARIILLSAEGLSAAAIAERLGVVRLTVYKWRQRYVGHGLGGLHDRPRPGQPRRLSPAQARDILRWTVERIPHEATHWSLRLMAKHARVSQWHVAQVWKAADLRPHRLNGHFPSGRGPSPSPGLDTALATSQARVFWRGDARHGGPGRLRAASALTTAPRGRTPGAARPPAAFRCPLRASAWRRVRR